jgi:hypothetical protein
MRPPQPSRIPGRNIACGRPMSSDPRRRIAAQTAKRQTQITHCCAAYSRSGEVRLARKLAALPRTAMARLVSGRTGISQEAPRADPICPTRQLLVGPASDGSADSRVCESVVPTLRRVPGLRPPPPMPWRHCSSISHFAQAYCATPLPKDLFSFSTSTRLMKMSCARCGCPAGMLLLHGGGVIVCARSFKRARSAPSAGHHFSTHGRSTTSNAQVDRCWPCSCR